MAAEKITRERLYKLVWEKPLRTLAQKYNISERELRKVCYRMNVPVPGSGYWSKLKFGKTVEREYLPFQEENIFIELFLREDPLGKEYFETEKTRLRNEKLKNKMVKPAENFPKLDPWVVNTKIFYEKYIGASRAIREE